VKYGRGERKKRKDPRPHSQPGEGKGEVGGGKDKKVKRPQDFLVNQGKKNVEGRGKRK